MKKTLISKPLLERVPLYLKYLYSLENKDGTISATTISQALKLGEVQVRKDLNAISGSGKPRIGYIISELIITLEDFIGATKTVNAVLVGAGKLGVALFDYKGFADYGVNICAAFDNGITKPIERAQGKVIYPMEYFSDIVNEKQVKIGIITVPEKSAQQVADLMVTTGIRAIWNFAPCRLEERAGVTVRNENMASSLALIASEFKD